MNQPMNGEHPSEEVLMEQAVSGVTAEIQHHIDGCTSCARIVREFMNVKQRLASFGEEKVPLTVERHILTIPRHGHKSGVVADLQHALLAYPFLIALIVAIVVIILSFLVGSEVLKGP